MSAPPGVATRRALFVLTVGVLWAVVCGRTLSRSHSAEATHRYSMAPAAQTEGYGANLEVREWVGAPANLTEELGCLQQISDLLTKDSRLGKLSSTNPERYCLVWPAVECNKEHSVTQLMFRGAGLPQLPDCFDKLPNVNYADFEDNHLKVVPPSVGSMSELESLDLEGNELVKLPPELGKLKKMLFFDMDKNKCPYLPEEFANMESIEEIDWSLMGLKRLPSDLSKWTSLGDLFADENELTELPESFGSLKKLRFAVLSNNHLERLPDSIGDLKSLKRLHLMNNRLTELPWTMGNLQWMYELDIRGNKLRRLPKQLGWSSRLKILFADDNELDEVPDYLSHLLNLKVVTLAGNNLTAIPPSWKKMGAMKELNLSENNISELPKELSSFNSRLAKATKKLYLAGNKISKFNREAAAFVNLRELVLDRNRLTALPKEMSNLKKLTKLKVSHNANLTHVPDTVVLPALKEVDLAFTNLERVPLFLMGSPNLEDVNMGGLSIPVTKDNMARAMRLVEWSQKHKRNLFRISQELQFRSGHRLCRDVEYRQSKYWNVLMETDECRCANKFFRVTGKNGGYTCEACPKHAECTHEGGLLCHEGYYLDHENKRLVASGQPFNCTACPRGAYCEEGSDIGKMKVTPGYWRASNNTDRVIECHNYQACLGQVMPDGSPIDRTAEREEYNKHSAKLGESRVFSYRNEESTQEDPCESGYTGPVCAICKEGYFSSGVYGCTKCPPLYYSISWAVLLNIFGGAALLFILYKSESVMLVKIIINFTQMTSSLPGTYDVAWPPLFKDFAEFFGFFNLDFVKVSSAECLFRHGGPDTFNFYHSLAIMTVVPIVLIAAIFGFYLTALQCFRWLPHRVPIEGYRDLQSGCMKMAVLVMIFMYLPVSFKALKQFKCHEIEGELYLMADYKLKCYDSSWWRWVWISVATLTIYTVGVPVFCVSYMLTHRKALSQEWMLTRFGSVYKYYKTEFFWYYFFDLFRCLLVGGAAMFFSSVEVYNLSISIFITFLAFSLHVALRPFILPVDNFVQSATLFLLMATMVLGVMRLLMVPEEDYRRAASMVIFSNFAMISILAFRYVLVGLKLVGRLYAKLRYKIDHRKGKNITSLE